MTHSVQTSVMNLGFDNNSVNNRSRFNPRAMKFYQVDIEDFDNEVYSYEVEARNDEEAALKADKYAKCVMFAFSVSMEWKYSFESGELSVESFHFQSQ